MTLTKAKPHRPSLEHRKRVGQHHRHSHVYLKTYWPYLPVVAILLVGLIANNWVAHLHRSVLGYATDMSVQSLLNDTNAQREADNESDLSLNNDLIQAAQAKANDMAARDYWSHDTPDGKTPWTFITAAGYNYQTAGENLAYGFATAADTVQGWMNSPEHRANILNTTYQDVGFGFVNISNYQSDGPETLVVAMYGSTTTSSLAATPATTSLVATTQPSGAGSTSDKQDTLEPASERVSQLQLVSANLPASTVAISLLGIAAFAFFIIRHGLAWRRAISRGERFITHHPILDIIAVSIAVAAVILSRTAGLIR